MSEENVEVMAAALDALNRRDMEAALALVHKELEWRPARSAGGAIEGTVYQGKEGVAQYMRDLDSGFDELLFDIQKIDSVGPDRVFYWGRITARGTVSGAELDVPVWGLWEIRDKKLFRGQGFLSEEEALEAAGLSE